MAVPRRPGSRRVPTDVQAAWLRRGSDQPGGKLPLFDERGQRVKKPLVNACLKAGWAERWFDNPLKPDWLVCRLTDAGRTALAGETASAADTVAETVEEVDERQGALI
jgi:hypothetical protein